MEIIRPIDDDPGTRHVPRTYLGCHGHAVSSSLRSAGLIVSAALAMTATACAHARPSSANPSYTAAQAVAGETAYAAACLTCHTAALSGSGDAPALAGPSFARRWNGRPFVELNRYMREHMPRTVPGVLNDRTYLALVAYVLARNGVPASEAPLTLESTGIIRIGSGPSPAEPGSSPEVSSPASGAGLR